MVSGTRSQSARVFLTAVFFDEPQRDGQKQQSENVRAGQEVDS